jgi:site-specific DNA recombinase
MSITIVHSLAEATALRPSRRLLFAGRVSDEDEEDKSYGLEIQEDDVRKFAHECDWDLILDPAYSGYESGRIPLEMRRIYQRIKRDARQSKFDAVCFGRINRIARRSYFSLQLIEELKEVGVEVLTADLRVDTTQPAGEYVRQIMIATAEFDASSILKNTSAGREKRLKTGKPWLAPRRMYGYRYTRPSAMGKNDGAVTKHDEEAHTIIWMFERRAANWSYDRIAAQLTADGKPSPAGLKAWSATTVRNIINNESYRGTGKWGRHKNTRTANGKRSSRLRHDGH